MAGKRQFGSVDKLPSGRWRARYTGPDGRTYTAKIDAGRGLTFETKGDADRWLALRQAEITRDAWNPPAARAATSAPVLFESYAAAWLAERELQTRTRELYAQLLANRILPTFGGVPVPEITPAAVRSWYAGMGKATPTAKAHAYALLRTILGTAVADDLIAANPCRIRGAGQTKAARKLRPASLDELAVIVAEVPERYRMMVQLACWCSLRFGELAGLRRRDVDLKAGVVRVRQAVVRTKAGPEVKAPKSMAGTRDVTIPAHIVGDLREHLRLYADTGNDGLVFPAVNGGPMPHSAMYKVYRRARQVAGRPDLSFHDLRHTGQTFAAMNGANLRELMNRAGQSTPSAALRYLHEVDGRQREIAERLAAFASSGSNVTPLAPRVGRKASPGRA